MFFDDAEVLETGVEVVAEEKEEEEKDEEVSQEETPAE